MYLRTMFLFACFQCPLGTNWPSRASRATGASASASASASFKGKSVLVQVLISLMSFHSGSLLKLVVFVTTQSALVNYVILAAEPVGPAQLAGLAV